MEYDVKSAACKDCNCNKELKCTRMCVVHTCKSLVNYLTNIDTVTTKIGEFSSRVVGGKQDLVVSGHQVFGSALDNGSILTAIDTALDANKKLSNVFGLTPIQVINEGREKLGISIEEAQKLADMIVKINHGKLVILPFKPGTMCIVSTPGDFKSEQHMEIGSVAWRTNKETHLLEAQLRFVPKGGGTSISYFLNEYMDKFKVQAFGITEVGEKRDDTLISMSNYGIIKPIEIVNKGFILAVDNTYVYSTVGDITQIIGAWNSKGDLEVIDKIKNKALNKMKENIGLLKRHRKYIAPYRMCEANTIEI